MIYSSRNINIVDIAKIVKCRKGTKREVMCDTSTAYFLQCCLLLLNSYLPFVY